MKTFVFASLMLLATPAFAQSVPEIQFDSVPNYPNLPKGMNLGEVPGVAVNSKGHVYVFTRSNSATGSAFAPAAAQLLEFDEKGDYVGEIGKGLYAWSFAHTVRIDKNDNIWAVDKGSDMIVRFNPEGRVIWVFGRRKESADEHAKPWEHPDPPLPHVFPFSMVPEALQLLQSIHGLLPPAMLLMFTSVANGMMATSILLEPCAVFLSWVSNWCDAVFRAPIFP